MTIFGKQKHDDMVGCTPCDPNPAVEMHTVGVDIRGWETKNIDKNSEDEYAKRREYDKCTRKKRYQRNHVRLTK